MHMIERAWNYVAPRPKKPQALALLPLEFENKDMVAYSVRDMIEVKPGSG